MPRVLIVFASVDGQAARIADRIGDAMRRAGHEVTLMRAESPGVDRAIQSSEIVVAGGSVRYGRHARRLERAVRENCGALDARPNAFFSVSMSAAGAGTGVANGYVEDFSVRTGWRPRRVATFAGALLYTRYNPVIRFIMRRIARSKGGDTDTSRDYQYTDWDAVERFAAQLS